MSKGLYATTVRVLQQLRHDPRTLALLWFMPAVLLVLLRYVFDNQPRVFDAVGPSLIAVFPLTTMFLVTSIATLRERRDGTLERLLALPLSKPGYVLGYGTAFGIMAVVQAGVVTFVSFHWLGLTIAGSEWLLFAMSLLVALLGVALGLLASAFANTEFQAVQFMPLIILPQFLLCGLLAPREHMASALEAISNVLPLSYVIEGLKELQYHTSATALYWQDMSIIAGFVVGALLVASFTLRRRT